MIADRLRGVQHKIVVLSGKGGVGKSTVATHLALMLAESGKQVGLMDVDVHGPSVPKMLGLKDKQLVTKGERIMPINANGVKVMSIGFLLRDDRNPVIWRGPMKMNLIRQFLMDVDWGVLDYLIIDCPPGTGDEPLSVAQLLESPTGAVVVTTPQELSLLDVRKSISFCASLELPVLGVVENMSGFACPHCGNVTEIFRSGGGERMAEEMGVRFLGRVPIEPELVVSGDSGLTSDTGKLGDAGVRAFESIAQTIESLVEPESESESEQAERGKDGHMRIAVPCADGQLCLHFGHCAEFALIDVDIETKKITGQERVEAPEHQPGLLPPWLSERGVDLVIAGGMGGRAQQIFAQHGVKVITGAPAEAPEAVVQAYIDGSLQVGDNICDH